MLFAALLVAASSGPIWCPPGVADDADSHAAFRGKFYCEAKPLQLQMLGASGYLAWIDGQLVADGPARFAKGHPEYQVLNLNLKAGPHVLAIDAHNEGVTTRILAAMKPFILFEFHQDGLELALDWKCARILGYAPRVHRISDILGWIDWFDTSQSWQNWQQPGFDDSAWKTPVQTDPGIGSVTAATTRPTPLVPMLIRPIAHGELAETYGYERDDPAVRFFLRDLHPNDTPAQGVWRRYDLSRIRLGRPRFTLDLPKGAVVEFAYCEALRHGRVSPWITLSGSSSCNMDHFVARGGAQEFLPSTPKGGRFMEVHILSTGPVRFVKEEFLESAYYGEPTGSFACDDPLLNRIWTTGVDTVRACAEDALVDCPTRERGEWTGDVASVSTDICAVAYGDLSLSRRALVQAAQAARSDGLVAGVGPGDPGYLSTYAAQWVTACVHYWELTGDKSLLTELEPAAEKNLAAFSSRLTPAGVSNDLGWAFVDWGYVGNEGPSDMALNLHYYMALKSMIRWSDALGVTNDYSLQTSNVKRMIRTWISGQIAKPGGWSNVGYHRASLALMAGLVEASQESPCIGMIEKHLLACFPNDPNAPRLSNPGVSNDRIMTPYFCHFAFAALLQHGEIGFVLKEYRKCWGWALDQGATTWLEVFDTRWSHCHEWSGCPTWQLSRYVLGLQPRFDRGPGEYDLRIEPGFLKHAEGVVPTPSGRGIRVEWQRTGTHIALTLESKTPIKVRTRDGELTVTGKVVTTVEAGG